MWSDLFAYLTIVIQLSLVATNIILMLVAIIIDKYLVELITSTLVCSAVITLSICGTKMWKATYEWNIKMHMIDLILMCATCVSNAIVYAYLKNQICLIVFFCIYDVLSIILISTHFIGFFGHKIIHNNEQPTAV